MLVRYTENDYGFDWEFDPPSNIESKIVIDIIMGHTGCAKEEAVELYDSEDYDSYLENYIKDVLKEYFKEDAEAEYLEHNAYEKDMEKLARESRSW